MQKLEKNFVMHTDKNAHSEVIFIQKSFQPILLLEDYRSFQGLPCLDLDFFFKKQSVDYS